ncbi:MAG TPA: hypothetical protein VF855_13735 [Acidimicrobiales bacterium]
MAVTVTPSTFALVMFDAAAIEQITADVATRLGLGDIDVAVEVDETTPIARISATGPAGGPVVVHADSGALEDTRKPRQLGEAVAAGSLGRVLMRLKDRWDGGFADAPADGDLSLAQAVAWDTYCVARLDRAGIAANQQRWRYAFRNRHGFTDIADRTFDQIWAADSLSWAELDGLSAAAVAARQPA